MTLYDFLVALSPGSVLADAIPAAGAVVFVGGLAYWSEVYRRAGR